MQELHQSRAWGTHSFVVKVSSFLIICSGAEGKDTGCVYRAVQSAPLSQPQQASSFGVVPQGISFGVVPQGMTIQATAHLNDIDVH